MRTSRPPPVVADTYFAADFGVVSMNKLLSDLATYFQGGKIAQVTMNNVDILSFRPLLCYLLLGSLNTSYQAKYDIRGIRR